MTIQDIIESVTEQDSYRRDAEIKRRIAEWAESKLPALQAGYERTITGVDYDTGEATYIDRATAEIEAEAEQARLASLVPLMGQAHLFRALLQRNFGAGAEVNRAITADAVTGYFATATGLSGDDVRDGVLLKELFETLANWNGTGETWTLFEKYGEVIP
jgi:hypothetical protein